MNSFAKIVLQIVDIFGDTMSQGKLVDLDDLKKLKDKKITIPMLGYKITIEKDNSLVNSKSKKKVII